MASQPELSEASSTLERLIRNRNLSLFLPFIFGFSNNLQSRDFPQQDQPSRVVLFNPFTQGMVVIEGASGLDSLLRELANSNTDEGQPPASKSAIEALPRVECCGGEEECAICLDEFLVGGFATEMPCKHRFHEDCVGKWLGVSGSCPVCRHKMPVDDEDESESKRRVFEREIWVSFSFNNHRTSGNDDDVDDDEEEQQHESSDSSLSGSTNDDVSIGDGGNDQD